MDVGRILSEIDAEIARLQQARTALVAIGVSGIVAVKRGPGRPKGSGSKKAAKPRKRTQLTSACCRYSARSPTVTID